MKQIKSMFYLVLVAFFIVSCNTVERSMGFTNWSDDGKEYKFFLGTDQAVQVVRDLDQAWADRDYDKMREFISDTAKFYWPNGVIHNGADEFINAVSSNEVPENAWTLNGAFSIDIDPTIGGEHVHASISGNIADSLGVKRDYHEKYYVIDGKVVTWHQWRMNVRPKDE